MNTEWRQYARLWGRRLNALSLRERVIMAASIAAALAAVVDFLALSPQFALQRTLVQKLKTDSAELNRLRSELAAPAPHTPQAQARQSLAQTQAELAAVDQQISARLAGRNEAAALPELLQQVLRRHERLVLVKLDAVPPAAAAIPAAASGAAAPRAQAAALRRSVDVQLAGRYADLQAYAAEIERTLPGLRWASLHIDGQQQPPLLSARVWLAGGAS
jgi:hypothetical protein